jgi:hypothetical protein
MQQASDMSNELGRQPGSWLGRVCLSAWLEVTYRLVQQTQCRSGDDEVVAVKPATEEKVRLKEKRTKNSRRYCRTPTIELHAQVVRSIPWVAVQG